MLYQAPSPQRKKEPPPRENKLRLFLKRSSEPLLNLQNAAQQVILILQIIFVFFFFENWYSHCFWILKFLSNRFYEIGFLMNFEEDSESKITSHSYATFLHKIFISNVIAVLDLIRLRVSLQFDLPHSNNHSDSCQFSWWKEFDPTMNIMLLYNINWLCVSINSFCVYRIFFPVYIVCRFVCKPFYIY